MSTELKVSDVPFLCRNWYKIAWLPYLLTHLLTHSLTSKIDPWNILVFIFVFQALSGSLPWLVFGRRSQRAKQVGAVEQDHSTNSNYLVHGTCTWYCNSPSCPLQVPQPRTVPTYMYQVLVPHHGVLPGPGCMFHTNIFLYVLYKV